MLINYFVLPRSFVNFVSQNYANTPYMKKIFIAIIFAALFSSVGRSQTKTHFEYPTAPDSLATLQEKTSYIVLRFWDKADMKNC